MDALYALHVKSVDALRSANWYVEHLSATIVEIIEKPGGEILVRTDVHGIPVNFTQHVDAALLPIAPPDIHIGLEHFGVIVDDLVGLLTRMEAAGVEVIEPVTDGPDSKWAFVRGPENLRQELVELRKRATG